MRIKTYFVKSVEEAIAQARKELGDDALLLNSRQGISPDGQWPGYQVVFGVAASPEAELADTGGRAQAGLTQPTAMAAAAVVKTPPASRPRAAEPAPSPVAPAPKPRMAVPEPAARRPIMGADRGIAGLDELHSQMDEIHALLLASGRQHGPARGLPFLDRILSRLTRAGFSTGLAGSIVDGMAAALASESTARYDPALLYQLLRAELSDRIKIDANLGGPAGGAIIAMVGPAGAGKTTTLMKLAAFQAGPDRPVRILAVHGSGIGDRMNLQFFARKTGVAFAAAETPERLPEMIAEAQSREIVLIDTPGNQTDAERGKLAGMLASVPGVDVHLVLPAYMSAGACREAIRKYSAFWPAKLVATKLDETTTLGAVVSEASRAGLALSLVTDGFSVPDSLHSASVDDLAGIAMGRELEAESACA